ncbi:galactose-3-O-sulfotransferase 2-like [Patiria miniata]|uniref:Uncharacterized protein n=1 Tax=Patiria miniata TaxID=46514 RepID=A0A914B507_PATMI|nr:galactose-3-O-sulfotransferase 2-like [Patiria miniata]
MCEVRPNQLIFLFLVGAVVLSCLFERFGLMLRTMTPMHVAQRTPQAKGPTGRRLESVHRRPALASRTVLVRSRSAIPRSQFLNELQGAATLARDHSTCDGSDPQVNLVFVKTHKTGSTTLSHIINRFGYTRGLSFAINKKSVHNGHLGYIPLGKDSPRETFLPPIGVSKYAITKFKYNLMTVHVRYDRAAIDSFMKSPTRYVTILRDPGFQFESAFSHFQFDDAFLTQEKKVYSTATSRLARFLDAASFYRERLKHLNWEGQKGLRWYYAKNNQMYDLGLDHTYHTDQEVVDAYIRKLEAELDLVLITEYYDESLLLLKSMMCWDTDDVLYVAKNMRPPTSADTVPESLRARMRKWNAVDAKLHAHFNRSLWERIERYGPAFQSDLAKFREELESVFQSCVGDLKISSQGRFRYSNYRVRAGSGVNCTLIAESKSSLFSSIWGQQAQRRSIN